MRSFYRRIGRKEKEKLSDKRENTPENGGPLKATKGENPETKKSRRPDVMGESLPKKKNKGGWIVFIHSKKKKTAKGKKRERRSCPGSQKERTLDEREGGES